MSAIGGVEGYISSFLSVYLKLNYGKPESLTGTVMMVTGVVYSLFTALTGLLIDLGFPKPITILFGLALLVTSILFMDLRTVGITLSVPYLWCSVVFGVLEAASAMVQVSVLPLLVSHDQHPNQELRTERMAGVYNAGFYGGAFLGPIVGGGVLHFTSYPASFGLIPSPMCSQGSLVTPQKTLNTGQRCNTLISGWAWYLCFQPEARTISTLKIGEWFRDFSLVPFCRQSEVMGGRCRTFKLYLQPFSRYLAFKVLKIGLFTVFAHLEHLKSQITTKRLKIELKSPTDLILVPTPTNSRTLIILRYSLQTVMRKPNYPIISLTR
eukprot:sb/3466765/